MGGMGGIDVRVMSQTQACSTFPSSSARIRRISPPMVGVERSGRLERSTESCRCEPLPVDPLHPLVADAMDELLPVCCEGGTLEAHGSALGDLGEGLDGRGLRGGVGRGPHDEEGGVLGHRVIGCRCNGRDPGQAVEEPEGDDDPGLLVPGEEILTSPGSCTEILFPMEWFRSARERASRSRTSRRP